MVFLFFAKVGNWGLPLLCFPSRQERKVGNRYVGRIGKQYVVARLSEAGEHGGRANSASQPGFLNCGFAGWETRAWYNVARLSEAGEHGGGGQIVHRSPAF
ncbi:MAG TPA: hypothetical protein ENJ20_01640 [Bacteroidetes bacterium]|nr:hypothetical protein [Bacteroidota bacterium]